MENIYKNITENSLQEMQCLIGDVMRLIKRDYSHVSELGNIPQIFELVNLEGQMVDKELDRRDDEDYLNIHSINSCM